MAAKSEWFVEIAQACVAITQISQMQTVSLGSVHDCIRESWPRMNLLKNGGESIDIAKSHW